MPPQLLLSATAVGITHTDIYIYIYLCVCVSLHNVHVITHNIDVSMYNVHVNTCRFTCEVMCINLSQLAGRTQIDPSSPWSLSGLAQLRRRNHDELSGEEEILHRGDVEARTSAGNAEISDAEDHGETRSGAVFNG